MRHDVRFIIAGMIACRPQPDHIGRHSFQGDCRNG